MNELTFPDSTISNDGVNSRHTTKKRANRHDDWGVKSVLFYDSEACVD